MRRAALAVVSLAACAAEQTGRDLCDLEGVCAGGYVTWGMGAQSLVDSTVDVVAVTPDEPPWFGGRWSEDIRVAERDINSFGGFDGEGSPDAFLARTGVRRLETLGAAMNAPYPLRPFAIVPDAEDGARLFAIGQQEDTRHRVEAAWIDRTSATVVRDTVALMDATGTQGSASVAVDGNGWPIVAVSGVRIDLDGQLTLGQHSIVFRLGQGFRREPIVELPGVDVADLAVSGGVIAISGTYAGMPELPEGSAPWRECPAPLSRCGFVAALDLATGRVRWAQRVHGAATDDAVVHAVGIGSDHVVAMASVVGAPTEPALGVADVSAYLITFDVADNLGEPAILDQTIIAQSPTTVLHHDLAVAADGAVVIALAFRGDVSVGTIRSFSSQDPDAHASVVAELGTDLLWKWHQFLFSLAGPAPGATAEVSSIAVGDDQVVIGGRYLGAIQMLSPLEGEVPLVMSNPNGFAFEFHR